MSTRRWRGCLINEANPPPDTNQIPTVRAKIDHGVHRFVFWLVVQSEVELPIDLCPVVWVGGGEYRAEIA